LKLADVIQDKFVEKGCVAQTEDCGILQLCNFLIGYKGKLFEIMSDFQMSEVSGTFTAVGSGTAYAMGALYVMQKTSATPENKIIKALEAASCFVTTVGPPFLIETV
jgi:ATP-dependent protease HslVU (ClpYQ) peptidase subunit